MKQIHGLDFLIEQMENKVNLGKKAYEEETENLCTDYVIPLLKKYITDETKTPLLIRGLKTFEDNGYTDINKLSEEDYYLNHLVFMECLTYTKYNTHIINSDLKEETKIDLIVNEFVNGDTEKVIHKYLYEQN